MAFINFDCPECGHNLEVDERGAGFIVKCPECQEPIQIPDMPQEEGPGRVRVRLALIAIAVLLVLGAAAWAVAALRSANARTRAAEARASELADQLDDARDTLALQLETQQLQHREKANDRLDRIDAAARVVLDRGNALLRALDDAEKRLIENSKRDQEAIVRADMKERLAEAKAALPAPPVEGDAEAGRGLQNSGRTLVFPVLLGAKGQTLRENAEIVAIDGEQVSVRFGGGTATYRLAELHPGVVAFLPAIDPLLLVPPAQRKAEALRLHQLEAARRAESFSALAHDLDVALHAAP